MSEEKPREIAVRLLLERDKGEFIETLLENTLERVQLKPEDRGLVQELTYGVARWQLTLDWLITQKTGGKKQKPIIQNVLRLGLYQMFWLDRVPSYAAVNESVELCKGRGLIAESKFVNAVLRRYGREADATRAKLQQCRDRKLSLGFSHPDWLCRRWEERWSKAVTVQLLEWNNSPPPTYARVNELKTTPSELAPVWEREGVKFAETKFEWTRPATVFQLLSHPAIGTLKSFQNGLFYVQDPSTLLAVQMLAAQRGESIFDVCAAPGGKTTCIAQWMQNHGQILAQDIDPERLKMVAQNIARLGATCVTIAADAFAPDAVFDRVLVDVPCSNTGVMRRRVELRWRISPEEIHRLTRTQLELLKRAAQRLRRGGTLVYSTCSLEREENHALVSEFLAGQSGFTLAEERELTPMTDQVDGAYCARLVSQ